MSDEELRARLASQLDQWFNPANWGPAKVWRLDRPEPESAVEPAEEAVEPVIGKGNIIPSAGNVPDRPVVPRPTGLEGHAVTQAKRVIAEVERQAAEEAARQWAQLQHQQINGGK